MAVTTFEEAKQCPKCGEPGDDRKTEIVKNMKRGVTVHHIYCVNQRCKWYNTPWMVQLNADGSIPPPTNHKGSPKVYSGFENHDREAEALIDTLKRNAQAETEPGTEIRRRGM
jgi:hypothetical protein